MSLREGHKQMSMIIRNVEELIEANHSYRQILRVLDWEELTKPLRKLYLEQGRARYPVETGFKCLYTRYRGIIKTQFQNLMEGLAHNLKRLCKIGAPPLILVPI